jgi:hypothetical protein
MAIIYRAFFVLIMTPMGSEDYFFVVPPFDGFLVPAMR